MSAADKQGCFGVQMWIRLALKPTVLIAWPISPRVLVVLVRMRKSLFLFVVCHIPDASKGFESVCSVWNDVFTHVIFVEKKFGNVTIHYFVDRAPSLK